MIYYDARDALSHAYRILARGESLRGTLADLPPGGDLTAQEWIVHATYIVKGMQFAVDGPYRRAIEASFAFDPVAREKACNLLAPRIECPSRAFAAYVLPRWAIGTNESPDWQQWTGITRKSQRTLQRWNKECCDQATHFLKVALNMTTDHFRDSGICVTADVA